MGLFDVTQDALEQALAGSALRQKALADNLANANTPGFRRSDVDFQSKLAGALSADGTDSADAAVKQLEFSTETDTSGAQRADRTADVTQRGAQQRRQQRAAADDRGGGGVEERRERHGEFGCGCHRDLRCKGRASWVYGTNATRNLPSPRTCSGVQRAAQEAAGTFAEPWTPEQVRGDG